MTSYYSLRGGIHVDKASSFPSPLSLFSNKCLANIPSRCLNVHVFFAALGLITILPAGFTSFFPATIVHCGPWFARASEALVAVNVYSCYSHYSSHKGGLKRGLEKSDKALRPQNGNAANPKLFHSGVTLSKIPAKRRSFKERGSINVVSTDGKETQNQTMQTAFFRSCYSLG